MAANDREVTMGDDVPAPAGATLARIVLPPDEPITQEEIERRRALFAKVMALRDEIGPIGLRADDLVHLARGDADASDE